MYSEMPLSPDIEELSSWEGNKTMMLLLSFIRILCEVLVFAIVIRALLSWVSHDPYNPIMRILYEITEPALAPLRRIVPRIGMLDITPFIAIIVLQAIASLLP